MEPGTGDGNPEHSETGGAVDQPVDSADGIPGSSSELKEAARVASTSDVREKEVEGPPHEQVEKNGDCITVPPEDQRHASTENKSEKKFEHSDEALVGPPPSTESQTTSARAVENNYDDNDQINCGSPIVISSTERPQSEISKEGDKSSSGQGARSSNIDKGTPKIVSVVVDPEITKTTNEGKSFTFDVHPSTNFSEVEAAKKWLPFPTVDGPKDSPIVEGSPSTLAVESQDPGSGQTTGRRRARGRGKASSESKPKRASGKAGGKGSAAKGNILKEPMLFGWPESGGKSEPTPSISELRASALPTSLEQSFTELQQVQLRAQILVYGSLISNRAPDEVQMMSAFGGPDGGRIIWERAWLARREKIFNQTANVTKKGTPKKTQRASTQAINKGGPQNHVISSDVGQASGKNTPPPVLNPIIPLTSPLWDVHAPSQPGGVPSFQHMFSPLHPNQAPVTGNYVGHGSAWTSQTPFHGPWVASLQTSALEAGARLPPSPVIESVKLTSQRETPLQVSSSLKNIASGAAVQGGIYDPTVTIGSSASLDLQKMAVTPIQPSVDSKKHRKRKKASTSSDNVGEMASQSRQEMESTFPPATATNHWAPVVVTSTVGLLGNGFEKSILAGSQSLIGHHKMTDLDSSRSVLTDETLGKVEEASLQAQKAAMLASASVSQSQELWQQLKKQKSSGYVASVEVKLASAAAAIAVAASVAKAAAAAASVASNAALQAKLMAEETLVPSSFGNPVPTDGNAFHSSAKKDGSSTYVPVLKGDVSVQEAEKRREVASAASLEAKNIEAVVKAAQLAAEAIEQAGKVISLGDSLSLSELIETGLHGFWKISGATSQETEGPHHKNKELSTTTVAAAAAAPAAAAGGPDILEKHVEGPLQNEGARADQHGLLPDAADDLQVSAERNMSLIDGTPAAVVSEETSDEKTIKVGSHVEVFKDGNGYKAAWFSADVLSLKDGKAYVSYSELQPGEGSGKLEEWVGLGSESGNAPKIRIPHPITATQFEGTRKRRRAAIRDYTFSVGDRVDAWVQDSWWEGVVSEEYKKQGTTVTVHFPAHGKTSVVKAWQIRPSLIWEDGEWVEWSSTDQKEHPHHEGDTPKEKRKKIGTPGVESKKKDKVVESAIPQKQNVLGLTDSEKVFNVGKEKDESKIDKSRTRRAGLRKHDSRVVFGVPKPGKKQKFMEVSKHYTDKKSNKTGEVIDDAAKLANYLAPRVTGPRERRNIPKVESRVQETAKSKEKVLKSATVRAAKTKDSSETTESALDKHKSTTEEKDASDIEESMKPTSESSEPRRSNRRIQPTSRLLEGLQSSLISPKAPSASHDKGSKSSTKAAAKGE